jgi:hypothetical protein
MGTTSPACCRWGCQGEACVGAMGGLAHNMDRMAVLGHVATPAVSEAPQGGLGTPTGRAVPLADGSNAPGSRQQRAGRLPAVSKPPKPHTTTATRPAQPTACTMLSHHLAAGSVTQPPEEQRRKGRGGAGTWYAPCLAHPPSHTTTFTAALRSLSGTERHRQGLCEGPPDHLLGGVHTGHGQQKRCRCLRPHQSRALAACLNQNLKGMRSAMDA